MMKVIPQSIPEVLLLEPRVFNDERGYFFESFNARAFEETTGFLPNFVQDNESQSAYGVLRGLHFQYPPYAQAKLVRVVQGEVYDVAVDIREGSPTFGQYVGQILSASNKRQMFIPCGFAHGFLVRSDEAVFAYKCDNFYHKESEGCIRFDDPEMGIDWGIPSGHIQVSDKDKVAPLLKNILTYF